MKRTDLLRVASRVAKILGPQDCLLVGGLAVGSHGYVRATKDVGFIVKGNLAEVRKRLLDEGIAAVLTKGDPLEGGFPCVKAMVGDVRVDVMPPLVPLEWERAIEVPLTRATVRVVDLEGLFRLKLKAGGPKDVMDVAALALRHPEFERKAREMARAFGLADSLGRWLADPRLKAEIQGATSGRALERLAEKMRKPPRGGHQR
ncbi:MAG TPA: hypothetical protein VJU18_08645 [Vicinamibacteria bacterium]|nr:hypothetical protein [Vicinamibacteria bacterium]